MWEKQQHTSVESVHDNEKLKLFTIHRPASRFCILLNRNCFSLSSSQRASPTWYTIFLVSVFMCSAGVVETFRPDGSFLSLRRRSQMWHFTHTPPARQEIVLIHIRIFILTLMTLVPFGALKKSNIGESVNFDLCNRSQVAKNIAASRFN